MNLQITSHIQSVIDMYSIQGGPNAPSAALDFLLQRPQNLRPSDAMLKRRCLSAQMTLARGASVTAIVFGWRSATTFDRSVLRMPVFERIAPLGLGEPRRRIVCALVAQHLVQAMLCHLRLIGALILLAQLRPQEARRLLASPTPETPFFHFYVFESVFLGLPLYACRLGVELGIAGAKRFNYAR